MVEEQAQKTHKEHKAEEKGQRRRRPEAECDMVMKGGIASGVVYPKAITELMSDYRLRSLGGTSAGAIAAAAAAAAELGRAGGSIDRLEKLPGFLGENLENLIQPNPETASIYGVLISLIDKNLDRWGRFRDITRLATAAKPGVFLAAWLVLGVPAWISFASLGWGAGATALVTGILAAGLALLLALGVAVVALGKASLTALAANGFGACDGLANTKPGHVPLTEWLTTTFDELAFGPCKCLADAPSCRVCDPAGASLTFAELVDDGIDLLMMTTSLSMRRPFRVPFESDQWLWCDQCMAKYFPARIVAQLTRTSEENLEAFLTEKTRAEGPAAVDRVCPLHPANDPATGAVKGVVRGLPAGTSLPVVIGVRLSLSFPGLFSAVPLLIVDRSRKESSQQIAVVWMTDGGLSSNFPIHFFDSLLPRRPTFGIDLLPVHPDFPDDDVYLPQRVAGADYQRVHAIDSFVGFGAAIKDTMQNWADGAQGTLPGYRDRVVQVRMSSDEGGLNLRMTPEQIGTLVKRGQKAAIALRTSFNFDRHRETRYRVSQPELDVLLLAMQRAWDGAGGEGYPEFLGRRIERHEELSEAEALEELGVSLSPKDIALVRYLLSRSLQLMMVQANVNTIDPFADGRIPTLDDIYAQQAHGGQPARLIQPRPRLRMTSST